MPDFINPFDEAPGYDLASMTTAINILPNEYGRVNELGLFAGDGISTTAPIIDIKEGVLNLLPTVPRGGPPTMANRDNRSMKAFVVPHVPHEDKITPDDLQGIRGFGLLDQADPLAKAMNDRQMKMRAKHGQTLEFMRIQALKGVLRDGNGVTLYNWFTEFGVSQKTVDFVLGTAGTNVAAKAREVVRWLKKNLNGESMTGARVLVSPTFWDKFINHAEVKDAYKYFVNQAGNPLRDNMSGGFKYQDLIWEEYDATFTLADGTTSEDAFSGTANETMGVAFPVGTRETFATYFSPANWMETVNTRGLELYSRQIVADDGSGVRLLTQSNPLPIVRRPKLIVKITSSN